MPLSRRALAAVWTTLRVRSQQSADDCAEWCWTEFGDSSRVCTTEGCSACCASVSLGDGYARQYYHGCIGSQFPETDVDGLSVSECKTICDAYAECAAYVAPRQSSRCRLFSDCAPHVLEDADLYMKVVATEDSFPLALGPETLGCYWLNILPPVFTILYLAALVVAAKFGRMPRKPDENQMFWIPLFALNLAFFIVCCVAHVQGVAALGWPRVAPNEYSGPCVLTYIGIGIMEIVFVLVLIPKIQPIVRAGKQSPKVGIQPAMLGA